MDAGRYTFVIDIPPDFQAAVGLGRRSAIQVKADATAVVQAGHGAQQVQNVIAQSVLYRGAGLDVVWPELARTAVIGMVFFAGALLRFRRTVSEIRV